MKNTLKLLLIAAIIWFPTFEPSDIFTVMIIQKIGMQAYIVLSIIFAFILYNSIEGRTIKDKFNTVKNETKRMIK